MNPCGTFIVNSSAMRAPMSSRDSTPSERLMRRIEPNKLMATGNSERSPLSSTGCSNKSALPPPGCFMTRSAISHSSRFSETGCLIRTSSPARSSCAIKSDRVSTLTWDRRGTGSRLCAGVDRRNAKSQRPPVDIDEAGRSHAVGKLLFDRKIGDGAREVCVCGSMAAYQGADLGQDSVKVQVVQATNDR